MNSSRFDSQGEEPSKEIRFDDIDALQNEISEEFWDWGPTREISQEGVNTFADITGDHQWIHVDIERCKKESPSAVR